MLLSKALCFQSLFGLFVTNALLNTLMPGQWTKSKERVHLAPQGQVMCKSTWLNTHVALGLRVGCGYVFML